MSEEASESGLADTLSSLREINGELQLAIQDKDFEKIDSLITKRGPVVSRLMAFHAEQPVPEEEAQSILKQESELKAQLESLQVKLGEDLGHSRKSAHAQRMYALHEPKDPLKKRF